MMKPTLTTCRSTKNKKKTWVVEKCMHSITVCGELILLLPLDFQLVNANLLVSVINCVTLIISGKTLTNLSSLVVSTFYTSFLYIIAMNLQSHPTTWVAPEYTENLQCVIMLWMKLQRHSSYSITLKNRKDWLSLKSTHCKGLLLFFVRHDP
jgi:hypothetical protein